MTQGQSFNQVLLDSIDDGLSVLGTEPRLALYQYLSTIHSIDREQIPDRLGEFLAGLRRALGSASKVIERLILKKLFQTMNFPFRETIGLDFADYVAEAKRRFEIISTKHSEALEGFRSKKGQVSG